MSEMPPSMTSHRPYLLRALWSWIADNDMTPHLLVDATQPGVRVPTHTVKDGRVVLNIADRAVVKLDIGNDVVSFSARFGGVSQMVVVPIPAVLAIYARETGHGMALPPEIAGSEMDSSGASGPDADSVEASPQASPHAGEDGDQPPPDDNAPPPRRGAHLRVVK